MGRATRRVKHVQCQTGTVVSALGHAVPDRDLALALVVTLALLRELEDRLGLSYLLISHDADAVAAMADNRRTASA
jgi:ABC-type microcin C transport system duplicated ATPase subunit YejF